MSQSILAIDDSADIHQLLRVRLKNIGNEVELKHALTGEDGFNMARDEQPDLILLDVVMPDATGFEVCSRLKSEPETRNIPVIFLTGSTEVDQKLQGFDLGAIDYIQKPFDPAELNARVRAALRTKRFQDMLAQRAMIDALTGLWNRAHFDQRLHEESAATSRYGRPLSVIMMDVDKFKNLNDTHGHPFGDEVLQAVGDVLTANGRSSDWPCRYGGEEFVVILRETDVEGALIVAERMREDLESLKLRSRGNFVPVTASFGVSSNTLCRNPADFSRQWLIRSADEALYAAKEGGRNRVCVAKHN